MTSQLYPKYKESAMSQSPSVDLDSDTIKVAVVDLTTDYTFSSAHQFKSSVPSYTGSTDQTLTNKTVTNGVFDDNTGVTFPALNQSGTKTVGAVVVYKDTGNAATSPVIAYYDGFTALQPNGGEIAAAWPTNLFSF